LRRADGIGNAIAAVNWEGEEQYRQKYRQKELLAATMSAGFGKRFQVNQYISISWQ
jgi:hypothetical protein